MRSASAALICYLCIFLGPLAPSIAISHTRLCAWIVFANACDRTILSGLITLGHVRNGVTSAWKHSDILGPRAIKGSAVVIRIGNYSRTIPVITTALGA